MMTHNRAERYKLFCVTSVIKKIIFMRILEINEYSSLFAYTYVILSQLHALFMIILVCSFDSSSSSDSVRRTYGFLDAFNANIIAVSAFN